MKPKTSYHVYKIGRKRDQFFWFFFGHQIKLEQINLLEAVKLNETICSYSKEPK